MVVVAAQIVVTGIVESTDPTEAPAARLHRRDQLAFFRQHHAIVPLRITPIQAFHQPTGGPHQPFTVVLSSLILTPLITVFRPVRRPAPEIDSVHGRERETQSVMPRVVIGPPIGQDVTIQ